MTSCALDDRDDLHLIECSLLRLLADLDNNSEGLCPHKRKRRHKLLSILEQIRSLREDKNISSLQSHEANPGNDEVQCTQQGRWCEADSLQKEGFVNPNEESLEVNKELTPEVLKEVKNLKRQNHITHAILGIMVVSSLIWRFSELSVALLVKDQLSHPFRAIGSFLFGRFKGSESGNHKHQLLPNMETSTVIQNFEVPNLPHIEIPSVFPTEDKNDHRSNGVMHEIVEFVSQNDSNYQNKS